MGLRYSHLSQFERQLMFVWYHYEKRSQREIGKLLRRSHSTIGRELKRNIQMKYVPTWYPNPGHKKYKLRIKERGIRPRLKNEVTKAFVIEKLKIGWTPEIIAGRLKIDNDLVYICHESIYQYIYKEAPELIQYLPRKHKKRRKKYPSRSTKIRVTHKTSIEARSSDINERLVIGHWESDSIVSCKQKPGCNVVVERLTRLAHITKLSSKAAQSTHNALKRKLDGYPDKFVQSITYDNGTENAKHLETNDALSCDSYFCLPYHSWEKGAVEQVNGLIRRYLPKKTDITQVPNSVIQKIEHALNSRPRKCLNFKTPFEAYEKYFEKEMVT